MASVFHESNETLGLSLVVATSIPNFYSGLLPSKMTISRFAADDEDRTRLYQGLAVASVMSFAEAAGASLLAKSWLPFILSSVVAGVLLWQYNDAIQNPHSDVMPINATANQNA
jgi:hypothetical protein